MSDEKRSSNLSMNDCFFEINFLLKLEVKLVSDILNIISNKILLLVIDYPLSEGQERFHLALGDRV